MFIQYFVIFLLQKEKPCDTISISSKGDAGNKEKSIAAMTMGALGKYHFKYFDKNGNAVYHGNIDGKSRYISKDKYNLWTVIINLISLVFELPYIILKMFHI